MPTLDELVRQIVREELASALGRDDVVSDGDLELRQLAAERAAALRRRRGAKAGR